MPLDTFSDPLPIEPAAIVGTWLLNEAHSFNGGGSIVIRSSFAFFRDGKVRQDYRTAIKVAGELEPSIKTGTHLGQWSIAGHDLIAEMPTHKRSRHEFVMVTCATEGGRLVEVLINPRARRPLHRSEAA